MERLRIIKQVKIKIAEIAADLQGQVIEDPTIDVILDETVIELLLMLPIHLIETSTLNTDVSGSMGNVYAIDSNLGYVILPADFLRLSSFKMTTWERPVLIPISEVHPGYIQQTNQYTRGGVSKPVGVLKRAGEEQRLYYYSVSGNDHEVEYLYYVAEVVAEDLQADLVDSLAWLTAAKTLEIYSEDIEAAVRAKERVIQWIQLKNR